MVPSRSFSDGAIVMITVPSPMSAKPDLIVTHERRLVAIQAHPRFAFTVIFSSPPL